MKFALVALASIAPMMALDCNEGRNRQRDRGSFCEIREQTIAATGRFTVDGGTNGGVAVKGWKRSDVVLRAQIQTNAEDDSAARAMVSQIRIDTSAGQIRAQGPEQRNKTSWAVSYELMVPERVDLCSKR